MLNLVEEVDFNTQLNQEIKKLLISFNKDTSKELSTINFSPQLVGQDNDGTLIFTWRCRIKLLAAQTFLALYNGEKSQLIFTQEKDLRIVSASVNRNRTLVAFSIVEVHDAEEIYKSYIAEICPQNRVFSLNISWRTLQKVQFLREEDDPAPRAEGGRQPKLSVSHMLFFHHKESIGLYHIPVTEKDGRFIMSMQPSTEQISDPFVWSQFDVAHQRLFVLKLVQNNEKAALAKGVLSVLEFHSNGEYEHILQTELPLSLTINLMEDKATYHPTYISSTVSSKSFNMSILTDDGGSLYLCYQYPPGEKGSECSDITSVSSADSSTTDVWSVNYTVCCIHGAYAVHCSYSVGTEDAGTNPVSFSLFSDYLVVFLPGFFLHLLDVSSRHEPVHNLLLHNDTGLLPEIPSSGNQGVLFSTLLPYVEQAEKEHQCNGFILDNVSLKGFVFEVSTQGLLKFFLLGKPATRLAILHASMTHFGMKRFTQEILKRACQDSANVETTDIFREYLILSTYGAMKSRLVSPLDLKLLPLTASELYRGQVQRKENGEPRLYLHYKEFKDDMAGNLVKILCKRKDSFWHKLFENLSYEVEHRNKRFPLKVLQNAFLTAEKSTSPKSSLNLKKEPASEGLQKSHSSPSLSTMIFDQVEARDNELRNNITADKMASYFNKAFGKDARSKAFCNDYSQCRLKIISFLWKVILKSLKYPRGYAITNVDLNEPITDHDAALFQLLERLNLLVDELCFPRFPNMKQMLCFLGFRCLSAYQFFQYVDAYIIELDAVFVRQVLLDLPNDPLSLKTKAKLISMMPREAVHSLLREWNYEWGNRYLATHTLNKLSSESVHLNCGMCEQDSEDFVPLRTLVESCKLAATGGSGASSQQRSKPKDQLIQDIEFVGKVALERTNVLIS